MPKYKRPYLIVKVCVGYIEVLNISSTKGKEHKLLFPNNKEIKLYNPPLDKPSFVKLDSLTKVTENELKSMQVLSSGVCLNVKELRQIINLVYNRY